MIDHMRLTAVDLPAMLAFYDRALAPLGYGREMEFGDAVGYGRDGHASLWIVAAPEPAPPTHLALMAADHAAVEAFHAAALAAGGRDNGGPGLRPHYHPDYYAAFVIDPAGNNLEAVCHKAP